MICDTFASHIEDATNNFGKICSAAEAPGHTSCRIAKSAARKTRSEQIIEFGFRVRPFTGKAGGVSMGHCNAGSEATRWMFKAQRPLAGVDLEAARMRLRQVVPLGSKSGESFSDRELPGWGELRCPGRIALD